MSPIQSIQVELRRARLYQIEGDFKKAIHSAQNALSQSQAIQNVLLQIEANTRLGDGFFRENNHSEAIKKYLEGLDLAQQYGYLNMQSNGFCALAFAYYRQGDYSAALESALNAA